MYCCVTKKEMSKGNEYEGNRHIKTNKRSHILRYADMCWQKKQTHLLKPNVLIHALYLLAAFAVYKVYNNSCTGWNF